MIFEGNLLKATLVWEGRNYDVNGLHKPSVTSSKTDADKTTDKSETDYMILWRNNLYRVFFSYDSESFVREHFIFVGGMKRKIF